MFQQLKPALILFALFTLLTGVIYPLIVTGVAQLAFPSQANGSLIIVDGKTVGSELIGQTFDDPRYFWGRPSAAGYDAAASSGSNLGPTNPALEEAIQSRIASLKAADPLASTGSTSAPIPVDLVTTSASGLDPHISIAAAYYQIHRIAQARGLDDAQVKSLVDQFTESRQLGFLGEPRVNVLRLNLALDGLE